MVKVRPDGSVLFEHANGFLGTAEVMDAEEFFQAKRDRELGRWRYPLNPDYVAYPREPFPGESRRVRVIRESNGDFVDTVEGSTLGGLFKDAARAFFEAHPVAKPWHEAEHGEVWEVTHTGGVDLCRVTGLGVFVQVSGSGALVSMPLTDPSITAARRVWPVDESVTVAQQVASSQAGLASIRGAL